METFTAENNVFFVCEFREKKIRNACTRSFTHQTNISVDCKQRTSLLLQQFVRFVELSRLSRYYSVLFRITHGDEGVTQNQLKFNDAHQGRHNEVVES